MFKTTHRHVFLLTVFCALLTSKLAGQPSAFNSSTYPGLETYNLIFDDFNYRSTTSYPENNKAFVGGAPGSVYGLNKWIQGPPGDPDLVDTRAWYTANWLEQSQNRIDSSDSPVSIYTHTNNIWDNYLRFQGVLGSPSEMNGGHWISSGFIADHGTWVAKMRLHPMLSKETLLTTYAFWLQSPEAAAVDSSLIKNGFLNWFPGSYYGWEPDGSPTGYPSGDPTIENWNVWYEVNFELWNHYPNTTSCDNNGTTCPISTGSTWHEYQDLGVNDYLRDNEFNPNSGCRVGYDSGDDWDHGVQEDLNTCLDLLADGNTWGHYIIRVTDSFVRQWIVAQNSPSFAWMHMETTSHSHFVPLHPMRTLVGFVLGVEELLNPTDSVIVDVDWIYYTPETDFNPGDVVNDAPIIRQYLVDQYNNNSVQDGLGYPIMRMNTTQEPGPMRLSAPIANANAGECFWETDTLLLDLTGPYSKSPSDPIYFEPRQRTQYLRHGTHRYLWDIRAWDDVSFQDITVDDHGFGFKYDTSVYGPFDKLEISLTQQDVSPSRYCEWRKREFRYLYRSGQPSATHVPTASFTAVTQSQRTVAFDASASTDIDGTITSYTWNFGDGQTGSGRTTNHQYSTDGTYNVSLTVRDDYLAKGTTIVPVTATNGLTGPTASFTATPVAGEAPLSVAFDASASSDDGSIVSYAWNFGDGTPLGSGVTANHTYSNTGTYNVVLTVTDDDSVTDTDTETIVVSDAGGCSGSWTTTAIGSPSISSITGSYTVESSGNISDTSDRFTFVHQQCDGDFDVYANLDLITGANQWSKGGLMSRESLNANAKFVLGNVSNASNHRVGMQWRSTTGADETDTWSWGQTLGEPRWLRLERVGDTFKIYHGTNGTNWTLFRTETVSLSNTTYVGLAVAATNQSSSAKVAFSSITLDGQTGGSNSPPTASFTATPSSGSAPLSVSFDGSASSDSDGSIQTYSWSFGDEGTGSGQTASHTYSGEGTYTATLTVTDDDGALDSDSKTITVSSGDGGCIGSWTTTAVGSPSISNVSGAYTIESTGNISDTSDRLTFVHKQCSGDFDMYAKVESMSGPNWWSKGVVMSRESLNSNSKFVSGNIAYDSSHRVGMQWRSTTGSDETDAWSWGQTLSLPRWIRLQRVGNTFSVYHGTNGSSWTLFRTETVSLSTTTFVGLAVAATNQSSSATVTFSGTSLTGGAVPGQQNEFGTADSDNILSKVSDSRELPESPFLAQNHPNPFNPVTRIEFALPEGSRVRIRVFNVIGEQVGSVADGWFQAGWHGATFDATGLPSGMYLYTMNAGSVFKTRRMVVLK